MISNLESENTSQLSKMYTTSVTPDVRATNKVVPGPDQLVKFSREFNVSNFPNFFSEPTNVYPEGWRTQFVRLSE